MTREDKRAYNYARNRLANDDYPVYSDEYELKLAYKAGIEDAKNHPHWISVEDELPNNYEPVIAAFDRHFARVCFHCGDTWYLDNPPVAEPMSGITHWMQIPPPPKKGGEE